MPKCRKCGANRTRRRCKFCELLAHGPLGAPVERCRQNNPNLSRALKVRPKDARKAVADAKKNGVPTDFTPEGHPVFESRGHQARYLKAYGYVNHDGGYGD